MYVPRSHFPLLSRPRTSIGIRNSTLTNARSLFSPSPRRRYEYGQKVLPMDFSRLDTIFGINPPYQISIRAWAKIRYSFSQKLTYFFRWSPAQKVSSLLGDTSTFKPEYQQKWKADLEFHCTPWSPTYMDCSYLVSAIREICHKPAIKGWDFLWYKSSWITDWIHY